jgi:hypothetical protein
LRSLLSQASLQTGCEMQFKGCEIDFLWEFQSRFAERWPRQTQSPRKATRPHIYSLTWRFLKWLFWFLRCCRIISFFLGFGETCCLHIRGDNWIQVAAEAAYVMGFPCTAKGKVHALAQQV